MENAVERHVGGRQAKPRRATVENLVSSGKKRIEFAAGAVS